MSDETLPPGKRKDESQHRARSAIAAAPVDQTSDTLLNIPPSVVPRAPASEAIDTQDQGHDPTYAAPPADGRSLVPSDPPPVLANPPAAAPQTVSGLPADLTIGAADPATQAYHQAALASSPKSVTTGASFGHYELLETIAKGGMGIVYKARQRNLNRIVAIKMILAGQFADQTDIDRFYAEAEAAAALSHPNIVAIHEIGEVQGQHFFSMDYIDGQSLAALVHENPLRPRRAAEFVRTIAETMQFAHESGVVHRDLKPANILLDKRQRPLITDFGLAKHVSGQSQRTIAGSIVGTPSYMPPEQASGKIDEIGPWSDLYSLGAILYELLTGRPPFRSASPFETIRQVLETEPLSPRLLNENVPRDLETICLKCLQKERARRYASAQELADELGRFLRGEPIQARPISQLARFWRLCKRNPVTASAIAAAAAFFVAASIVSTVAYVRTSAALDRAQLRFEDAMTVVDKLFTQVSDDTLLNQPGMQQLRKDLLGEALSYYQKFLQEGEHDPRVQDQLAAAHYRVGQITYALRSPHDSLPEFQAARQMQQRLLAQRPGDIKRLEALGNTINALGKVRVEEQEYSAALGEYEVAAKLRAKLAAADPANSEYQRILANTHMNIGLAAIRSAYAVKDEKDEKKFDEWIDKARKQFETAQEIRQTALKASQTDLKLQRDLGQGFYNLGDLARIDQRIGDAIEHFQNAVGVFEKLTSEPPLDLDNENQLAKSYRLLGALLVGKQDYETARRWYHQGLSHLEPLAAKNPDVVDYQAQQAGLLLNLSFLETQTGNRSAAEQALVRASKIFSQLHTRDQNTPRYQRDLAVTLRELARNATRNASEDAIANLREAIRLLTDLAQRYPGESEYALQLEKTKEDAAIALRELAIAQAAAGSATAANASLAEAIGILTELAKQYPDDANYARELTETKATKLAPGPP